eukprot:TRINITY_DN429_c0_g2_i1.p1 TRINITY_DN429_c0_g2~~TRINITY_DN429_c0_g2_i1.p1  ORF type:complete len:769 (+),score=197.95 TRINITY_DN429_c0_g2_i1:77-2383(+)
MSDPWRSDAISSSSLPFSDELSSFLSSCPQIRLLHKPRGSKGTWQEVAAGERLRVPKDRGKRLKLEVRAAERLISTGSYKVRMLDLDGPHPPAVGSIAILGAAVSSVLTIDIRIHHMAKRLQLAVSLQAGDERPVEGRSIVFTAHNSGVSSNARVRMAPIARDDGEVDSDDDEFQPGPTPHSKRVRHHPPQRVWTATTQGVSTLTSSDVGAWPSLMPEVETIAFAPEPAPASLPFLEPYPGMFGAPATAADAQPVDTTVVLNPTLDENIGLLSPSPSGGVEPEDAFADSLVTSGFDFAGGSESVLMSSPADAGGLGGDGGPGGSEFAMFRDGPTSHMHDEIPPGPPPPPSPPAEPISPASSASDTSNSVTCIDGMLEVNGVVRARGFMQYSDMRLKTNIADISDALDIVTQLQGKTYEWKHEQRNEGERPGRRVIGLIAQEVQRVVPEVVQQDAVTGILSVSYAEILPIVIEALKQFINVTKSDTHELRERLNSLSSKLSVFTAAAVGCRSPSAHESGHSNDGIGATAAVAPGNSPELLVEGMWSARAASPVLETPRDPTSSSDSDSAVKPLLTTSISSAGRKDWSLRGRRDRRYPGSSAGFWPRAATGLMFAAAMVLVAFGIALSSAYPPTFRSTSDALSFSPGNNQTVVVPAFSSRLATINASVFSTGTSSTASDIGTPTESDKSDGVGDASQPRGSVWISQMAIASYYVPTRFVLGLCLLLIGVVIMGGIVVLWACRPELWLFSPSPRARARSRRRYRYKVANSW